ncbi:MAG: cytochrome c biogenesis protein CcsA [Thermoplasmata archaeon]
MLLGDLGTFLLVISALACIIYLFVELKIVGFIQRKHSWICLLALSLSTLFSFLIFVCIYAISDFSFHVVWMHTSKDLPIYSKVSSIWAGQEGSLFLWIVMMLAIILFENKRKEKLSGRELNLAEYSSILAVSVLFVFILALISSEPFRETPSDLLSKYPEGRGLDFSLQNEWMLIHPLLLISGYACTLLPFVNSFGAAVVKKGIPESAKLFARISWLLLGAGIATGAIWAYETLGWGGYWSWDPVEVASLLPFISVTGALHLLSKQKRHPILATLFSMSSFVFSIFATIITRSGNWFSVHAWGGNNSIFLLDTALILATIPTIYASLSRYSNVEENESFEDTKTKILSAVLFLILFVLLVGLGVTSSHTDASFFYYRLAPLFLFLFVTLSICSLGKFANKKVSIQIALFSIVLSLLSFAIFKFFEKDANLITYKSVSIFLLPSGFIATATSLFGMIKPKIKNEKKKEKNLYPSRVKKGLPNVIHIAVVLIILGYSCNFAFAKEYKEVSIDFQHSKNNIKNMGVKSYFTSDLRECIRVATFESDGVSAIGKMHIYQAKTTNSEPAIINTLTKDYHISWLEREESIRAYPSRDNTILIAHPEAGKVLEVDLEGNVIFSHGENGEFTYPTSITKTKDGTYVIADPKGGKVVEIDHTGKQKWVYSGLKYPVYAERVDEGKYAPSDNSNAYLIVEAYISEDALDMVSRVFEVNSSLEHLWQFGGTSIEDMSKLFLPSMATKLPNRNTLIVDTYHHQVIEINPSNEIVFRLGSLGTQGNGNLLSFPSYAQRLNNGNTLVTDFGNCRIVEFSPDGKVVRSIGENGSLTEGITWAPLTAFIEDGNYYISDSALHGVLKIDENLKRKFIYESQIVSVIVKEMPFMLILWTGTALLLIPLPLVIFGERLEIAYRRKNIEK